MGTRERPVKDDEFKRVLSHLGFTCRPKSGTSHEQWVKGEGRDFRRVTVDAHHAPYSRGLLKLMLHQAGLSKRDFFAILERL
ncbi:type II toxin-antitoxin system HicA family toxin [Lysobacter sp. KIS68-7]|uniref:type II toxin-antitoxin system HicA family toxin n=1 Tax=Lysobacter sp. KIS68-7 TaxID=2904252 RepID=UPI001E54DE1D|nr:type II toxin-antitoxin system HicA family toxin [Lysobacter sp. KIS68-7]UHQ19507.1 type II toxin-antitoxin system HicA family toxin [Lysobacter sp. KIS68-7]